MTEKIIAARITKNESDIMVLKTRLIDHINNTSSKLRMIENNIQNNNSALNTVFNRYDDVRKEMNELKDSMAEENEKLTAKTREGINLARQASSDSILARQSAAEEYDKISKERKHFETKINLLLISSGVAMLTSIFIALIK